MVLIPFGENKQTLPDKGFMGNSMLFYGYLETYNQRILTRR